MGSRRQRATPFDVSWRTSRPRGETTDSGENPAGSRVPALVATMGLGRKLRFLGKYKLACIFADLLRSVGGSMISNAAGTAWNAARRILRATPSAAGPDVGLDGLRTGFGWFGDGFWATWGAFWRDLRPVGRDWRALEASWKGLESPGGLWRGLGTPRSQDFEDVSSRLLDSWGPGS